MENVARNALLMGRVCKRGHVVTGNNAIPKRISGQIYQQCRTCKNIAEVERRKHLREREANRMPYQKEYRHIIRNAI